MTLAICTPKSVEPQDRIAAAQRAVQINPVNDVRVERLAATCPSMVFDAGHLALLTSKYHGSSGVDLSVQFLDSPDAETKRMLLSDEIGANAWGRKGANIRFRETTSQGQIRVARLSSDGYWSYLGTDIFGIPQGRATMNLASITSRTPVSEIKRVVMHEFGHSCGFPHEHMRAQIIEQLEYENIIAAYQYSQRWSRQEVIAQVLTPLDARSIRGTPNADDESIMCYQIPAEAVVNGRRLRLTKNGLPIPGGLFINDLDYQFAASVYPGATVPTPPAVKRTLTIEFDGDIPPFTVKTS